MFDFSPSPRVYRSRRNRFPQTTEDAWRRDWQNIGGDFRRACALELKPNDTTLDAIAETNDPIRRSHLKVYNTPTEFFADIGI